MKAAGEEADAKAGLGLGGGAVKEERTNYGSPHPADLTDMAELRRRAIAAAGRFESGLPDLSVDHDRYLAEEQAKDGAENRREALGRPKKGRGTR